MSSEPKADELVELAAVVRAHGLNGELLLKVFNPESELLFELERVFVRDREGQVRSREVESTHDHGGSMLMALKGVDTREQAEALRGSVICVPRTSLPALDGDEHYIVDLVGIMARDASGKDVGEVVDVIDYPSVCCFVIASEQGRVEVPYTDRYVTELDAKARTLVVDRLEELDVLRERPKPEKAAPKPRKQEQPPSDAARSEAGKGSAAKPKKGER